MEFLPKIIRAAKTLERVAKKSEGKDWWALYDSLRIRAYDVADSVKNLRLTKVELKANSLLDLHSFGEYSKSLAESLKSLSDGRYIYDDIAGHKEDFTSHAHRFIIIKKGDILTGLFLDPEHHVGKRDLFRAPVCNLLTFSIVDNVLVTLNMKRFLVEDSQKYDMKLENLERKVLDDAIEVAEQNNIFDLEFYKTGGICKIVSRYISKVGTRDFKNHPFIKNKVKNIDYLFEKFVKTAREGGFKFK